MKADSKALEMLRSRKGAVRRADVTPEVLAALNAGLIETITLSEWLAMDLGALLAAVLPGVGWKTNEKSLLAAYDGIATAGVQARMKGIGRLLHEAMRERPDREDVYERLASHASDVVRSWAGYALTADREIELKERLRRARRFAADPHMAVRECAWDCCRSYVVVELDRGLTLLEPWVRDKDANVRRCAVEATRPCGVWTSHISALKAEPGKALPLLEPVRSDPSRYVQNSVANWLNDASKSQPAWVIELCRRWEAESPTKATAYIVRRGLRTPPRQGSAVA